MVAHEFIIDLKPFSKYGITPVDVTKRLQYYGYHAPTVSWPVPDSLMIEPTESENINELNRFCQVLINIKKEIDDIKDGKYDKKNNVLKNAPHTLYMLMQKWDKPYSKKMAFYPLDYLHTHKFWPRCGRIDEVKSDREFYNLTKNKT